ncbi:phosphate ABC transporter permease subunit PstC [Fontisphaera persica]|uniref:phosphate ABC transporter permease subunit PstC n=1 Tax=Fontisphaera persica TaxID=2974023 RepID=UPI0024BF5E96|nr:phosphate ABC transporter permease subunit PstC [Fontisphaera persica]WCJ59939.1 phosphate ABC transporter permease subunit PstC [Fontisphaera persica]
MPHKYTGTNRPAGWMGLHRGHKARPLEWLAEKFILLVSLSATVIIFLIFLFVTREALPIILGRMDSSAVKNVRPLEDFDKMTPQEIQAYLHLKPAEYARMDREALLEMMKVRLEAKEEIPDDKDARVNTTAWRYLLLPYQWSDYDRPEYIWQPISQIPKYNLIPLIIGSLKASVVALLFAVPLALGAAIYVSQLASPRLKEWLKPGIELLAGIPSVVLGFFALIVMASFLQHIFGYESRLNAFVAGIALGLAIIPVVFSIAEDALTSVPRSFTEGALALGSTKWQAAWHIVLPAAVPGVFAAVVLGFGRAIGETMIVLMASGNASIVSWSLLDSTRTMTATIAAEMAETVVGGHHYRMLFLIGALLFLVTFIGNMVADWFIHRLKKRLEGRA